jgi:hypothetical protein
MNSLKFHFCMIIGASTISHIFCMEQVPGIKNPAIFQLKPKYMCFKCLGTYKIGWSSKDHEMYQLAIKCTGDTWGKVCPLQRHIASEENNKEYEEFVKGHINNYLPDKESNRRLIYDYQRPHPDLHKELFTYTALRKSYPQRKLIENGVVCPYELCSLGLLEPNNLDLLNKQVLIKNSL